LDVIFPLYHLREWICPGGHKIYQLKPENVRTREERFHADLYAMPEYEVVGSLCNAAKHYNARTLDGRTKVSEGFRAGLGRVGDSLGVTHFMVDGRDIRDFFWPVYRMYFDYFNEIQSDNEPDTTLTAGQIPQRSQ
jgi:hypothetical protein